jgi:uncharacterized protein (DUF1330 family)
MADIRAKHTGHFFDRKTLRFFDSRIERSVYQGPGGVYFLTSEQFHGSEGYTRPRKWTVRHFNTETGAINTAQSTDYNKMDKQDARELAKLIAHGAQVNGVQS